MTKSCTAVTAVSPCQAPCRGPQGPVKAFGLLTTPGRGSSPQTREGFVALRAFATLNLNSKVHFPSRAEVVCSLPFWKALSTTF